MKQPNKKENFSLTDIDSSIASAWKPSDGVNWDKIQRMRFKNIDCEIDPEDSYSEKFKNKLKDD